MKITKRDKTVEEFDSKKIKIAIQKAFDACDYVVSEETIDDIVDSISIWDNISVEDIQDQVEETLMDFDFPTVAKEYIIYRYKKGEDRFVQERLEYMEEYSKSLSNAATSSETDANANVSTKNVANLEGEVYKLKNRSIQRRRMRSQLYKDFPEVAKQYEKDLENHIIYVHDEASSPVPKHYCMAVSLYPFLEHGTSTMDGLNTEAPHNLNSFCGQFINLIFLLSSQCKGAVGYGEFFNFFDWACVQAFGENYPELENEPITTKICNKQETVGSHIEQCFQNIVYSMNQPAGNRSYQSPFTNFNYFDSYYWHSLFDNFVFPDGSKPKWERVSYLQKKFMKWFNKERTKTLLTYPVESMCLLNDGKDYVDKEYKEFTAEMWAEGHSFFVYTSDNADSVASCCRLRNDIKLFTSTTGLTGIEVGSCNVITLNLNRITQDYFKTVDTNYFGASGILYKDITEEDMEGFKKYLIDILERVYKYQVAYKNILYKWEERGMITAVNAGYIHMNKLYSTYGINGINESAEFLGMTVGNNKEYKDYCTFVLKIISDYISSKNSKKYMLNLEAVPAEALGVKNYNWDKEQNYWVPEDRNLYNSYFYNAHDPKTTILDRFVLHGGEIAKAVSGGQAVHCSLQEHLSKEQYIKLLEFAVQQGTNYFTFNIPNTQCDDCLSIYKYPLTTCPKCGSHNMTQWTRVVGFLRPIKTFSIDRQIEEGRRVYSNGKKELN